MNRWVTMTLRTTFLPPLWKSELFQIALSVTIGVLVSPWIAGAEALVMGYSYARLYEDWLALEFDSLRVAP